MKHACKISNMFFLVLICLTFTITANAEDIGGMERAEAKLTKTFSGASKIFYELEKALLKNGYETNITCKQSTFPVYTPAEVNDVFSEDEISSLLTHTTFPHCKSEKWEKGPVGRGVAYTADRKTADEFCRLMGYEAVIRGSGNTGSFTSYGNELVVQFDGTNWVMVPHHTAEAHFNYFECGTTKECVEDSDCPSGKYCLNNACVSDKPHECIDGKDNDGDGLTDNDDFGCKRCDDSSDTHCVSCEESVEGCTEMKPYTFSDDTDGGINPSTVGQTTFRKGTYKDGFDSMYEVRDVCQDNKNLKEYYATTSPVFEKGYNAYHPTENHGLKIIACDSKCFKGACVECINNNDCSGKKPVCDTTSYTCTSCPDDKIYNGKECVECTNDDQSKCKSGQTCNNNKCEDVITCTKNGRKVTRIFNNITEEKLDVCRGTPTNGAIYKYACSNDNKSILTIVVDCLYGCNNETLECTNIECDKTDSSRCRGDKPYCNFNLSKCVQCLNNEHCPNDKSVCDTTNFQCTTCPQGEIYNYKTKSCTECVTSKDCPTDKPLCNNRDYTCNACENSVYVEEEDRCMECTQDNTTYCKKGQVCHDDHKCMDNYVCSKENDVTTLYINENLKNKEEDKCYKDSMITYECSSDGMSIITANSEHCQYGCSADGKSCKEYECDSNDLENCKNTPNPVCNISSHKCVECLTNSDCKNSDYPICNSNNTCEACPDGKVFNGTNCVECVNDSNCPSSKPVCDTTNNKCVVCLTDAECSGETPVCNTTTNTCTSCPEGKVSDGTKCVECTSENTSQCENGQTCENNICKDSYTCETKNGVTTVKKNGAESKSQTDACVNNTQHTYSCEKSSSIGADITINDNTKDCGINGCNAKTNACFDTECESSFGESKRACQNESTPVCNEKGTCVACPSDKIYAGNGKCAECTKNDTSKCQKGQTCNESNECEDVIECQEGNNNVILIVNKETIEKKTNKCDSKTNILTLYNCSSDKQSIVSLESSCKYRCSEGGTSCDDNECNTSADCKDSSKPKCENHSCKACQGGTVYDASSDSCVECTSDTQCTNSQTPKCDTNTNKCIACPVQTPVYDGTNCVKCYNDGNKVIGCIKGQKCVDNDCQDVYECSTNNGTTTVTLNGGTNQEKTDICTNSKLTTYSCKSDDKTIHEEETTCEFGCASDNKSCKKHQCDVNDNSNCQGDTPVCDTEHKSCVECLVNSDCKNATKPVCNSNHTCEACSNNQVYNGTKCVECINDENCLGDKPICDTTNYVCTSCPEGKVSDGTKCVECTSDSNCSGDKPICDKTSYTCTNCPDGKVSDGTKCVECINNENCSEDKPICDKTNNTCTSCPNFKVYNGKECVECVTDTNCANKPQPNCKSPEANCIGVTSTPYCNIASYTCVECLVDSNCPTDKPICNSNQTCEACPDKQVYDGKKCVDCISDENCKDDKPVCDTSSNTCKTCPDNKVYNKETNTCEVCYVENNNVVGCDKGQACIDNTCQDVYECNKENNVVTLTVNGNKTTSKDICSDSKKTTYECSEDKKSVQETKTDCKFGCNEDGINCNENECSENNTTNCTETKPYCDIATSACVVCLNNDHCKKTSDKNTETENKNGICDETTHTCVQCTKDEECRGTMKCEEKTCVDSQKPIIPIFNCVQDNYNGTYTAYFGYENPNEGTISIPACSKQEGIINTINDLTEDFCEQKDEFEVGRSDGSFYIIFNKDQEVIWTLQNTSKEAQTVKANASSTKCLIVEPTFQCIDKNDNGTFKAHFGYNNKNEFNISIPLGKANSLSLGEQFQYQPIEFIPGNIEGAFNVDFAKSVTWTLNGKEVKVTSRSNPCTEVNCTQAVITNEKTSLHGDEFVKMLKAQSELLLKEEHPYEQIRNVKSSVKRRLNRANKTNALIKSLVMKLPDIMFNCDNADFCPLEDNEPSILLIKRKIKKLHRQVIRTVLQRNIKVKEQKPLLNKSKKFRNDKFKILEKIPRFANNCGDTNEGQVFKIY